MLTLPWQHCVVFDGQERSGFQLARRVGVAGWGVGGDPPGALGARVLSAAVVEFPVSCPPPQGTVDVPLGQVFGFCGFAWDRRMYSGSPERKDRYLSNVRMPLAVCSER